MNEIDYSLWAEFICGFFNSNSHKISLVLDIACGTGKMTEELAKRGYQMIGADISAEMLSQAKISSDKTNLDILYIQQDMRFLDLYGTVDAVVCCLDGINYLSSIGDVKSCFSGVYKFLNEGGLFIFDINTPYKFLKIYGDNDYILETGNVLCAWQNTYNKTNKLCRFNLSVFEKRPDGAYNRYNEEQNERCYSMKAINNALLACGFHDIEVYGSLDKKKADEIDERWYFICRK